MHKRRLSPPTLWTLLAAAWLTAAVGPTALAADDPTPVEAHYSVRWAGIEVGRFQAELRRIGERYHLAYHATTAGPLRWLSSFTSSGWAAGAIASGSVRPEHFRGQSDWGEGRRFWQVSFTPSGEVSKLVLDAATAADREPVPEPLMRGPDPLSLALQAMLRATPTRPFDSTLYDGRRAARVFMDCAIERSPIRLAALGGNAEQALVCTADGERLAGRSKRWSDEADEEAGQRPPARVWLVPDLGGLPHWPVRVEAESRFGGVVIELERLGGSPA